MNKFYTVKARHCVEETYRIKANSREDAIEEYAGTGEMIDREEEHGALELVSVQQESAPLHKAYSVLLAYPQPNDNGEPETYFTHVWGGNKNVAVQEARSEAVAANEGMEPLDFYPLLVLAGHIEAEAFGGDVG